MVQLSHPYMTTGKTIALTIRTFVSKAMSLLFNMLSRLVITFLPRSKQGASDMFKFGASQVVLVVKNPPANAGDIRDAGSIPGLGRAPEYGYPLQYLPGESQGQRSPVGYSPRGCKESDMTEAI